MTYTPKILAFAGSMRKDSYNKKLVKIAIIGAKEAGAEVTYIDLEDYPLPVYNQELEDKEGLPPNALKLKKLFEEHDGFLLSSPEYNSSIPGGFKNAIDWVSRQATPSEPYLSAFIDKVVVLMSASTGVYGGMRGLTHVREMFTNIFSIVLPKQRCIKFADKAFNAAGELIEEKETAAVKNLGKALSNFLKKYKA